MKKLRRSITAFSLFICLLLLAPLTMAATEIKQGILIDADQGVAYVMHPSGGIDAIAVATGQSLWHTDRADQPIAVEKGQLLAFVDADQAGTLELVLLEAATGGEVASAAVPLPAGVRASVNDGLGTSFRVDAGTTGDLAALEWTHSRRLVQGMPTAAGQRIEKTLGSLEVDMSSGQARVLDSTSVAQKSARAAIEGKFLEGIEGRQFLSSDGAYVLASQPLAETGSLLHRWQIYTLDGQPLGGARLNISYSPFTLADGLLLFVSNPARQRGADGQIVDIPMHLHGIDLNTGKAVWAFNVRDTTYRGPFPS